MTHDTTGPKPEDLTDAAGALAELGVSRATLERLIKAGDVTVYRNKLKPSERRFSIPELRSLVEYRPTT